MLSTRDEQLERVQRQANRATLAAAIATAIAVAAILAPRDSYLQTNRLLQPDRRYVTLDQLAIYQDQIAQRAVGNKELQVSSVTQDIIADHAVTPEKLAPAAVDTAALAEGAVTAAKIRESAVTRQALAEFSVTSSSIVDESILASKLAPHSVLSSRLADSAVGTPQLADGAVEASKLADAAVTSAAIARGAVGSDAIEVGAVGTAALADGAVAYEKFGEDALTRLKNELAPPRKHLREAVRGVVGRSGERARGSGFESRLVSTGTYLLTFEIPFEAPPLVFPAADSYGVCFAPEGFVTRSSARIRCLSDLLGSTPSGTNVGFSFTAMPVL